MNTTDLIKNINEEKARLEKFVNETMAMVLKDLGHIGESFDAKINRILVTNSTIERLCLPPMFKPFFIVDDGGNIEDGEMAIITIK